MPFGLIAALGVGLFAISLNEKKKHDNPTYAQTNPQRNTFKQADGSYRDTYGNVYQKLDDGSLIAIPSQRF